MKTAKHMFAISLFAITFLGSFSLYHYVYSMEPNLYTFCALVVVFAIITPQRTKLSIVVTRMMWSHAPKHVQDIATEAAEESVRNLTFSWWLNGLSGLIEAGFYMVLIGLFGFWNAFFLLGVGMLLSGAVIGYIGAKSTEVLMD